MSGSRRTAVALGTSAVLAMGGLLMVGQPAGAQESTNAVNFLCGWTDAAQDQAFAPSLTLTAPPLVTVGANGEISVAFADNVIAELPGSPAGTYGGAELRLDVAGGPVGEVTLAVPAAGGGPDGDGKVVETGPFTGTFSPVSAGGHTFGGATLVVFFGGEDDPDWLCKASSTGFAAIPVQLDLEQSVDVTASGSASPTPSDSETSSPTSSSSPSPSTSTQLTQTVSGSVSPTSKSTDPPLPDTGSDGNGLAAFGMLAGTAVLGALAVILSMPARRRRRQAQA